MAVAIRRAETGDLPEIVTIYNHAVEHSTATFDTEPFTVEDRRGWFAFFDAEHPLLVAVDDNRIGGFAYYLPYRTKPAYRRTKETTVYVAPDAQGRGIGSALYAALLTHARASGVHALIAVVAGANPVSDALHRKHGFTPVGHLPEVGHKHGAWVATTYRHRLLL